MHRLSYLHDEVRKKLAQHTQDEKINKKLKVIATFYLTILTIFLVKKHALRAGVWNFLNLNIMVNLICPLENM